jgi:hypothetical protein
MVDLFTAAIDHTQSAKLSLQLIPFQNQTCCEDEPQTAYIIWQGEADKIKFDGEIE